MSLLATVVSDGSPGSSLLMADLTPFTSVWLAASAAAALRARLEGWRVPLVMWELALAGPVEYSPPSSPDASREDGWRSAVTLLGTGAGRWEALRLRLPAGDVDGDIMILALENK